MKQCKLLVKFILGVLLLVFCVTGSMAQNRRSANHIDQGGLEKDKAKKIERIESLRSWI